MARSDRRQLQTEHGKRPGSPSKSDTDPQPTLAVVSDLCRPPPISRLTKLDCWTFSSPQKQYPFFVTEQIAFYPSSRCKAQTNTSVQKMIESKDADIKKI
jgi:hypothetical protein